ncbi:phosphotransferase [Shewanella sp. AS1]|uniref:phosphotransferase n=1 Tax=Shewanella sp. AS1 TaxID=2907626 RepID=UPI001F2EBB43|nr:phosphotransferase [Shewanella sp. AS1]MCE9678926.1 phosphotransferase [Shewanella sp. AS1]
MKYTGELDLKTLLAPLSASVQWELVNQLKEIDGTQEWALSLTPPLIPLSRGLSNQNYLLEGEMPSALRLNSQASGSICDRLSEVNNWRLAEQAQLAPRLRYVADDHSCYLSEFIASERDWSHLMTANSAHPLIDYREIWPQAEELLLTLLRQLSHLPAPENSHFIDAQWHEYLEALKICDKKKDSLAPSLKQAWSERYGRLLKRQDRVTKLLEKLEDCMLAPQFSHRDLNPHNLIYTDNKLWCIDFEYACLSHPLVDLASILATHRLSTPQRHYLIRSYLHQHPKLTSDALSAIPAAIELYWYFACCWALLMASYSQDEKVESKQGSALFTSYLNCFDGSAALLTE